MFCVLLYLHVRESECLSVWMCKCLCVCTYVHAGSCKVHVCVCECVLCPGNGSGISQLSQCDLKQGKKIRGNAFPSSRALSSYCMPDPQIHCFEATCSSGLQGGIRVSRGESLEMEVTGQGSAAVPDTLCPGGVEGMTPRGHMCIHTHSTEFTLSRARSEQKGKRGRALGRACPSPPREVSSDYT